MGGLFGTISKDDCVSDLFYGTDYHSHLGTRRGGLAVHGSNGFSRSIHNEADLPEFSGNSGVGIISDNDPQPLLIGSHMGTFAIVTVAKINNTEELEQRALKKKRHFLETSGGVINPTELASMLICEEESIEDGIRNAQEAIQGSCSMLLLTQKGIYAARDRLGRTPIVIGKKEGAFAVASESCAFANLGYKVEKHLGPGETVFLTADGYEQRNKPGDKMQICAFLWVYYGYPATEYEGINVEFVRNRCGAALARNDDVEIDFVAGIPDSGIGHAIGYANEKKIPYLRPFVKYTPTWPRSFMPQNQEVRDLVAKMKLIPIRSMIVQILFDYGASEVHMRPACPTLIFPCEFLNFSTSRSRLDLAGRSVINEIEVGEEENLDEYYTPGSEKYVEMIDRIRQRLRLTTLQYQKLDDMVDAIGLPKEKVCTHCWDNSSYF
jgi:amidophosphoribosyltransferase